MKVLLLHGLGRSSISMRYMYLRLKTAHFDAELLDYPSRSASISELTDLLFAQLPKEDRLNFVGHSLGGILAKELMLRLPQERRGRIVQLGSPNFGSEIAARAEILGPIMGPALAELEPKDVPDPGLDIGAIAGTAALPAMGLITGIEGENDGKVCVRSAWGHAPPEKRVKLNAAHSTMMMSGEVIAATIEFLLTGKFDEKWQPRPEVENS